jgi:Golgi nucleoside diphosphatase
MIEETFDESPFFFVKGDVKILTGQEEGAFSWITTNILAGTFNASSGVQIQETTFGSLDMGGASMQIAYECVPGK